MDEFAEINITPFTDVLLVLLIIFMMMAALIAPSGFEKRVEGAGQRPVAHTQHPEAVLAITNDGKMTLDGQRIDERTIYGALSALHAKHKDVHLTIDGTTHARYAYVIRAMDAAKAADIRDVSFLTE